MPARRVLGHPVVTRRVLTTSAAVIAALALATIGVAIAEAPSIGIQDAAALYIIAVVGIATTFGTAAAIVTGIAAVLLYDVLFIEPRLTLRVDDPREWLDLVLLLVVAVVVGRLAARQRERTEEASRLAREAQALFAVSRTLATTRDLDEALPGIIGRLASDVRFEDVWISLGSGAGDRIAASTVERPIPGDTSVATLSRADDERVEWVLAHTGRPSRGERRAAPPTSGGRLYRVKMETEGEVVGSIWGTREREAGPPSQEESRLLVLAADQMGLALRRDRLARAATEAEIAQRSDALKSALVDSVSHDLRTPLASIRATAGSLHDPDVAWTEAERMAAARTIDAEAARLDGLVRNLLDLGRIEAGELQPDVEIHDLRALIEPAIRRASATSPDLPAPDVDIPDDLPAIAVDAVFLDAILANLVENVARYAPRARWRIGARATPPTSVELVVEDAGPGVPDEARLHLFERFYRVPRAGEGARRGTGIGLSVVRGLARAMDGDAEAAPSELGGLKVCVRLPSAGVPVDAMELP
jgi:two-component system sensor histidine kinase KdpD